MRQTRPRPARTEGEMALNDPATLSPVRPSEPPARAALGLSAAVICLNEAACIGKCLESLGDCAEIVVVDSGSTDATARDCRRFCSPRLSHPLHPSAVARLCAAETVRARPDERALDLQRRRRRVARRATCGPRCRALWRPMNWSPGWKVRRSLTLYGQAKPVSRWTRPEHILRLVRRGRARFDPALIVHEGLRRGSGRDANRARGTAAGTSAACR